MASAFNTYYIFSARHSSHTPFTLHIESNTLIEYRSHPNVAWPESSFEHQLRFRLRRPRFVKAKSFYLLTFAQLVYYVWVCVFVCVRVCRFYVWHMAIGTENNKVFGLEKHVI